MNNISARNFWRFHSAAFLSRPEEQVRLTREINKHLSRHINVLQAQADLDRGKPASLNPLYQRLHAAFRHMARRPPLIRFLHLLVSGGRLAMCRKAA